MRLLRKDDSYKSWIEISSVALRDNLASFQKIVGPQVSVMCVVKSNAYGHGLKQIVGVLRKNKLLWFGVDSLDEALEIRSMGVDNPILVLGYIPPKNLNKAVSKEISFVVYDLQTLKAIKTSESARKAKIHVKIETGANRQGLQFSQLDKLAEKLIRYKSSVEVEGVYTHFANVEDTLDPSFPKIQAGAFQKALKILEGYSIQPKFRHLSATGAMVLYPQWNYNMVRLGIGLYGLWPSREIQVAYQANGGSLNLKPVLSWKSVISQLKTVKKGQSVGYGRTWIAQKPSKIAVVPVGYYDGYDRGLSNVGQVIVSGERVNVVGRIAMNMMMIDVSNIKKVRKGDEVILIGGAGREKITPEDIAAKIGTINYEIVSRINPLVPRVVV